MELTGLQIFYIFYNSRHFTVIVSSCSNSWKSSVSNAEIGLWKVSLADTSHLGWRQSQGWVSLQDPWKAYVRFDDRFLDIFILIIYNHYSKNWYINANVCLKLHQTYRPKMMYTPMEKNIIMLVKRFSIMTSFVFV